MALIENGSHALTVLPSEQEAALSYKLSTNAAELTRQVVKSTAIKIQGRKYVKAEGWLAIAVAHGCVVSVRDVQAIEGGIRAIAELRRMSDQALLATAEGFVGDDEKMWAGRPMFARRAMAQTRASSRVCRTVFAHVVVMIDAELGTTPAEEMQGVFEQADERPQIDPQDQHLVQGDGRSTYQIKHEDKSPGRLSAELLASNAIGVLKTPGMDLLSYNEWKAEKCTPKGTKTNGDRLAELREKHPDLADKIDEAVDLLPVAQAA